ncbi:hypothetical protein F0231_08890 [Vibrio sp. RE86]|uniref:luciferase domain-containing protein n=1 Tax=Vibrio sp. RE86 TaxID=2607605 RepID=UPI001493DDF1|nr:luciferase family protein [Vibrio sp. RE86]NOH79862.1 hypothetical protein [Vibrio sp. RE86]
MTQLLQLPQRSGEKPMTTQHIPHSQLNQHGPDDVVEKLHDFCFSLSNVLNEASGISVPGARALVMHSNSECNHEAFMIGREFAHIHPHPDSGSMHLKLNIEDANEVIEKGWGENHFLVTKGILAPGLIMVFSPRSEEELETIKSIIQSSYEFALGAN